MSIRIVLTALCIILSAIFFFGGSTYAQSNSESGFFLGVAMQEMSSELAQACGMSTLRGVYVSGVESGSPAQKSGIRVGDVITAINNKEVNSGALVQQIIPTAPKKSIISLIRAGVTYNILVTLQKGTPKKVQEGHADTQQGEPIGLWLPQNVPQGVVVPVDNFHQIFVDITRGFAMPSFLHPGELFNLDVEYTVTDTLEQAGINLPITLTYTIMQGTKIYIEKDVPLQAANGKKNKASKKGLKAMEKPGTYVLKITITYHNKSETTRSPIIINQ